MYSNENNEINSNNKKPYHHQSSTPYKNQHHNHKTPKNKFRPSGFSSPYHQPCNTETSSSSTPYNNQFRNFKDNNRQIYGNNNRNNHKNNRNSKNSSREDNISQYFHPSMLEDPWKKLEENARKLSQKSPSPSTGDTSPSSVT